MRILLALWCALLATHSAGSALKHEKMANGLELIHFESHKVPLVTIVLAVHAGGMTETPRTNGLTHLWEHMFFKGNKRIPDQEAFRKRIRQLGIVYNGDTSAELVRYYFTLPSVFLEEGLQFMADAIRTPSMDQKELERERLVVMNEYERRASSPNFDLWNLKRHLIYGHLEYRRDPMGLPETILAAAKEQMMAMQKEVFVPKNSSLLISGDFHPETLRKLAKKYFGDWQNPPGWKPPVHPKFPNFPATMNLVMERPLVESAEFQMTFNGPTTERHAKDSLAADVLISLLQLPTGTFYKTFIDSGLTQGAGMGYGTQSKAGEIDFYLSTTPEKLKEAQTKLKAEIPKLANKNYFTQEQLENVRRSLSIAHEYELNEPSSYIKGVAFWWGVAGLNYYNSYLDGLKAITFEEIQEFVKTWIINKPYISSVLISPEGAKKAGVKDNTKKLVAKHLAAYKKPHKGEKK